MKFISFTSGSCGNCCCVDGRDEGAGVILIDAGASSRRVGKVMQEKGMDISDVGAILITHDHLDHIRFLGTYCKHLMKPVCTTAKLHGALAAHTFTKDHIAPCRMVLEKDAWNEVCGFEVRWFQVPHDATQTVGYAIRRDGRMLTLMTDLEHVTQEALQLARESDTVIIESNYDRDMLLDGPYPPELKKRILGEGHLSNEACAAAIRQFCHRGLKNLFLCHLSGNNNTPALAYESAAKALEEAGAGKGSVNLRVLQREIPSPLVEL